MSAITREEYEASIEWLHLYPQNHWHDDAHIVGTRKGMEALRDALSVALEHADGVAMAQVFVNDGEGYAVGVYVLPFAEMDRMAVPYADDEICGKPRNRIGMWPHQLARKPIEPASKGGQHE